MGKGDKRTRRGKIYRGSHGNSRPHAARGRATGRAVAKVAPAAARAAPSVATKRAVRKAAPRKKAT